MFAIKSKKEDSQPYNPRKKREKGKRKTERRKNKSTIEGDGELLAGKTVFRGRHGNPQRAPGHTFTPNFLFSD